jgi:ATP-dependent 26S proteasome regulatory subunit
MGGGKGGSTGQGTNKDMFSIIYMFIATSVVDFIFKNVPIVINFFMRKYTDKLENIKRDLSNTTKDITDNKIKKKTASITVTINVNNPENILGHALLDFITNNKNTTHVSYIRESFILNQKDVITIDDDIFARMTESASIDANGNQGSISTNNSTGAGSGQGSGIVQIIEVYSFIKTTDQLRNFLDNIKQKYSTNIKNKLGNKRYYFNMHPLTVPMDIDKRKDMSRLPPNFIFVMKHFQTNRKFSNLFGEDIEAIRNRVNFFCKNRKWYDEKGIPYTLGLLLSGAPGTGKTSTIKCLANETNRHICNINLNNDMSKTQLENLFFSENIHVTNPSTGQTETYCIPLDQRIYVLEDVDCQSDIVMERAKRGGSSDNKDVYDKVADHYEDKHKVDLSFLLNLLDGVLENPGRIVIMTSNFPDTLDSALIRPGRIDVIAKFRNCTNKTVVEMMEFFYDTPLSPENKARIEVLQEDMVTPAELSKIMFENFSDMEASIVHMERLSASFVKKTLIEKEREQHITVSEQTTTDNGLVDFSAKASISEKIPNQEDNVCSTTQSESPDNYSEIANQYADGAHTPKIKIDTVYVFKTMVLPYHSSIEKIHAMPPSYYMDILEQFVFSEKFYKLSCGTWKCDFVSYFKQNKNLEEIKADGTMQHNIVVGANKYRNLLYDYFTLERMDAIGLLKQLQADGVIDSPKNDFKSNPGTGIDSYAGMLTESPLNSATYSRFL